MDTHGADSKIRRGSGIFLILGRTFNLLSRRFHGLGITEYKFIGNEDGGFAFCRALRLNCFFQAFISRRGRRRAVQIIMDGTLDGILRRRDFANFQQYRGRAALAAASE